MPMTPKKSAEEYAAENIQGRKHEPGMSRVPESPSQAVEVAEDILGRRCRDPDDGSRTDRAWASWGDGEPRVYVRVHDATIDELKELKRYGFEKHRYGRYLWRCEGFEDWDSLQDELSKQGEEWSTDEWRPES